MHASHSARLSSVANARAEQLKSLKFERVGRSRAFWSGTFPSYREIFKARELIFLLTKRDIKAKYKDSTLGLVWSFLKPLVQLGVYFFIVGQVLGAARGVPDFAIFVFIGITVWGLFSEIISSSTVSLLANGGLVKKIYTPREIFPLSAATSSLFNFLVQMAILILAVALFAPVAFSMDLLLIPLSIINLFIFSTALGLLLAASNVFLRDTQHLVEVAITLLFWFSPILYSYTFVVNSITEPVIRYLYLCNPITLSILGMQKALWGAGSKEISGVSQVWPGNLFIDLGISIIAVTAFLFISQRIFSRLQGNFAQVL
jgi:ABC-2 type transport system permease protein